MVHRLREFGRKAFFPEGTDFLNAFAFALLLILSATVPFLYEMPSSGARDAMGGGAVLPRGDLLLELFAFILLAATLLSRSRLDGLRPLALPGAALVLLAVLGVVQLLPLPYGLLDLAAARNLQIYHDSGEILGLFGRGNPSAARISVAPGETLGTVLLILAYGAVFLSAVSLLSTRSRRRFFLWTIFASAILQIVAAILREGPGHRLHGPFVNPNHFSAYLEVVLAFAFATILAAALTSGDRAERGDPAADRLEKRFLPVAGGVLIWAVLALGIGLTGSRGGLLSAFLTTLCLLFLAARRRPARAPARAIAAVGVALLGGALLVMRAAGSEPFMRFLHLDPRDLGSNTRVVLWRTSVAAWRQFPIVGSGLGTFREAFRRAQPRELPGLVEQAHSDFLQLLVTGGGIGAALGLLLFGSLFIILLRAWKNQKHREESALALAGIGALASLTLHGLVDFNLSIPAVPTILACALGCAWAAARYSRGSRRKAETSKRPMPELRAEG
ncbi:MAG: O-antigen ligase family protein [Acidobacteriota bacterium]